MNQTTPYAVTFLPGESNSNHYLSDLASGLTSLGLRIIHGPGGPLIWPTLYKYQPQLLHLHWLHNFILAPSLAKSKTKAAIFLAQLRMFKLRGGRIVWTAHNLVNHRGLHPDHDRRNTRKIAALSDAVITHSHAARDAVIEHFDLEPDRVCVIPHASYIDVYPDQVSREQARAHLKLDQKTFVFLFLGTLRRNKGITDLLENYAKLTMQITDTDHRLIVRGKIIEPQLTDELATLAAACDHIDYQPQGIADDQLQYYFHAADVAVLPYRDILTSGVAMMAMGFGCPCIGPNLGGLGEMIENRGVVYPPNVADALLDSLTHALNHPHELDQLRKPARHYAEQLRWPMIAQRTFDVYDRVIHR